MFKQKEEIKGEVEKIIKVKKPKIIYTCEICGEIFKYEINYRHHKKWHIIKLINKNIL